MPTVHRALGLCFMIYVDDHPPPHIHVSDGGTAKIAIDESAARVVDSKGISARDVKRALDEVSRERARLPDIWNNIHGRDDG